MWENVRGEMGDERWERKSNWLIDWLIIKEKKREEFESNFELYFKNMYG